MIGPVGVAVMGRHQLATAPSYRRVTLHRDIRIMACTMGRMVKARLLCVGVGVFLAMIVAVTVTTYGCIPAALVCLSGCQVAHAAGQHLGRLQAALPDRSHGRSQPTG